MTPHSAPTCATYTLPEAAGRLGISLASLHRLRRNGTLPVPVIHLGGLAKVRVAELEAYLQGSAPAPAPGAPTPVQTPPSRPAPPPYRPDKSLVGYIEGGQRPPTRPEPREWS